MKISVIVLARNEENIDKVISSILNQTLPPFEVIIVDDGTTDQSLSNIQNTDVSIIKFPFIHTSWVIDPRLSMVVNYGLDHVSKHSDYYVILGGDHVLQLGYFKNMIKTMVDENIGLSSGVISGESINVRGSGRIISNKIMREQNFEYKINYGHETYLLFKAIYDGNIVRSLPIESGYVSRTTGTNYTKEESNVRGKAYRALGYSFEYSLIMAIKKYRKLTLIWNFYKGFRTLPKELYYEKEIRKSIGRYEIRRLFRMVRPI